MAQQERAERTRNAILDAAAEVFDEHGLNGASLTDVLTRAGVTKGAMYFHFANKDDLAKAIVEEQVHLALPQFTTPDTAIQGLIDTSHVFGWHIRDNVRVRASTRLVTESEPSQVIDVYRYWLKVVIEHLTAARAAGDLREEWEPEAAAPWVAGSFHGVQLMSKVLTQRADLRDRITELWQYGLLPGLVPPHRVSRFQPDGTVPWDGTAAPEVST